ncbi:hypothetical protein [Litoreibacter roseus]|uniref:Uncharacterized protein n=1 Tax=Litoreibacter roseus TaxID=2601869 RepID=A0A6N6JLA1_9RHOB|nr:hypothetical protein [Litoreibacter roseus]GFE67101.1 hypothetical protein KIN_41750 [Litoreibacter roseus]
MRDPIHEETYHEHTIKIFHDPTPENPREFDNLGTMTCWHRRYRLGDDHSHEDPHAFLASLAEMSDATDASFDQLYSRASRKAVILPLYLYDHSGITMNTTGFHCPWDSGQVGFIHVSLDPVREAYGVQRVSKSLRENVENILRQEVAAYDDYLTGNCFGFVTERDGEEIDSCWGFLGDYEQGCLTEARSAVLIG